ncbi:MAG: undecaprenyl-phosphate glucose phosphotransferase [Flavobacteriaceae bacterium]|nr:undecaprenyl-phosphate glucose phosphotransferase [Flavobacteriaceae bacterium]
MDHSPGRYSKYLKLINIGIHVLLINTTIWYFDKPIFNNPFQIIYINTSWLIIAYMSDFYNTYRFTGLTKLIARLVIQYIVFFLAYFSFYAITQQSFNVVLHIKIFTVLLIGLLIVRFFFYFSLRAYRKHGGNFRKVVIIGNSSNDKTLKDFFMTRSEYGYKFMGFFSDKPSDNKKYMGDFNQSFDFILDNSIDEIYCSLTEISKNKIIEFIKFSEDNYKTLKFIPKAEETLRREVNLEYYDYIPLLTLRKNPLSKPIESIIKRSFDILFSLLVIVLIMSWLTPILWVLIKMESRGPLFFTQIREGLNGKQFYCYKFRSMYQNELENVIQTKKNDQRITFMGKFIRKTSIDELPQFINVFLGSMSVVGPRPHMLTQGKKFKEIVDKYAVRHFVKPGITGLAQVKGFRGEINSKADIQNRVKYDLFYIENWSLLLDLKIIVLTLFNTVKGEEKAY